MPRADAFVFGVLKFLLLEPRGTGAVSSSSSCFDFLLGALPAVASSDNILRLAIVKCY